MNDYIVGIDISSSKICGVVGKLDNNKEVQITGVTTSDYRGIKEDVTISENELSYIIQGIIKRLENIVGSPLNKVYISVSISLCEIVKTSGVLSFPEIKEISKEDIENVCEVARFSVGKDKEIVQVDIEEYIVDEMHNIDNPLGMKGKILRSEGNAFIISSKQAEAYRRCFDKIGIEVLGWIVNSIGMSKDILLEEEIQNGVGIIDVGSSIMEITVFKDKRFLDYFSIPLGGENITKDISICLKLPLSDSEKLKMKCSNLLKKGSVEKHRVTVNAENGQTIDINYDMLVDIIAERVKELLELIKNQIQANGFDKQISSYVIVGGGIALFRDITLVGKDILEKPVRIGIPNYVGAANPIYATATGIIKNILNKELIFIDENDLKELELLNEEDAPKGKFITRLKQFFKNFSNEEV